MVDCDGWLASFETMKKEIERHSCEDIIENDFQEWTKQRGIVCKLTATNSERYNGAAECLNRTVLDMARTVLLGMEIWLEKP